MNEIHAIVLAAGASRRLGQPKQLVEVDGKPLIARLIESLAGCDIDGITVVLGAVADRVRAACAGHDVALVVNDAWPEGIASSIRSGVLATPESASSLIAVSDQWRLTGADYQRLVEVHRRQPNRTTAAQYDGIAGVPAAFPPHLRSALLALTGDQGARSLIDDPVGVPMPAAASDLDVPDQLQEMARD